MKKRSLLLILVLTISLAIPIFLTQTQPVYTQPLFYFYSNTYQIPPQNLNSDTSIQITSNVTADLGVLIEGNIAAWALRIYMICYDPNGNITNITINSESHGTKINRGMMLPITKAFLSDENMNISRSSPPLNNYTISYLMKTETVLVPSSVAGLPSITSFNLNATVELKYGNDTISLPSDVPVVALVLPNPSTTPPVVNYYLGVSLSLAFLLPVTFVLTDRLLKRRRIKKESVEGV